MIIMLKREIGDKGEEIAVKSLKKKRYKIIERNFNAHNIGEIDIIAYDKEYVVFVEVRLRKDILHGSGAETVDKYKRQRLIKTAKVYMMKNNLWEHPVRFDVVSVTGDPFGKYEVEIIKNAFGEEG